MQSVLTVLSGRVPSLPDGGQRPGGRGRPRGVPGRGAPLAEPRRAGDHSVAVTVGPVLCAAAPAAAQLAGRLRARGASRHRAHLTRQGRRHQGNPDLAIYSSTIGCANCELMVTWLLVSVSMHMRNAAMEFVTVWVFILSVQQFTHHSSLYSLALNLLHRGRMLLTYLQYL